LHPTQKTWTDKQLHDTLTLMGKIIKKKDMQPGSVKRFVWPEADSHAKVDVDDDNVLHATLKKQPWDETEVAKERERRAKLH
jgi:hypothetical protein